MRTHCPVNDLATVLGYEVKHDSNVCKICEEVTDNTLLFKNDAVEIRYIDECTKVKVCFDDKCIIFPNLEFIGVIDGILNRIK